MTEQCKEQVFHEWRHAQCQRNAKRDGYCTQHHPESVKKRKIARDEKWKKERENTSWARLERASKKLTKLEVLVQSHRDSWAPDHPPHELAEFMDEVELILEKKG